MSLEYTVGATKQKGFYIQIPWHLRGTAAELMAGFWRRYEEGEFWVGDECLGFEFRDNGVQIERHTFPWNVNV